MRHIIHHVVHHVNREIVEMTSRNPPLLANSKSDILTLQTAGPEAENDLPLAVPSLPGGIALTCPDVELPSIHLHVLHVLHGSNSHLQNML